MRLELKELERGRLQTQQCECCDANSVSSTDSVVHLTGRDDDRNPERKGSSHIYYLTAQLPAAPGLSPAVVTSTEAQCAILLLLYRLVAYVACSGVSKARAPLHTPLQFWNIRALLPLHFKTLFSSLRSHGLLFGRHLLAVQVHQCRRRCVNCCVLLPMPLLLRLSSDDDGNLKQA